MTRFNIKWVIDLNLKAKTIKLVKEKIFIFIKKIFITLEQAKIAQAYKALIMKERK